ENFSRIDELEQVNYWNKSTLIKVTNNLVGHKLRKDSSRQDVNEAETVLIEGLAKQNENFEKRLRKILK
ncbi:unnamed protein product, partial [Rotaria magnacalcarata]